MPKHPVCGHAPALSRRTLLAAAPALGLTGLAGVAHALPEKTFEERAVELSKALIEHFEKALPAGERFNIHITGGAVDSEYSDRLTVLQGTRTWAAKTGWY